MRFQIVEPKYRFSTKSDKPGFYLEQDNWNDFNFQTQYHLHRVTKEDVTYIGVVKILKKGQTSSDPVLLQNPFSDLGEEWISLGQNLDYYQHLAELGDELREDVLVALRDLIRFPNLRDKFQDEDGWRISLFRYIDEKTGFLNQARLLLTSDYTTTPSDDLKFSFQMTGWDNEIEFNFSPPSIRNHSYLAEFLPGNVVVLIGKNGSGKSTLLARLARVAHGSMQARVDGEFDELGKLDPVGIGFPRVISFSYSAFDSFHVPGTSKKEKEQIVKDMNSGEGRFVFCGLRDIAGELRQAIDESDQSENDGKLSNDRLSRTLLKPIDVLTDEFVRTLKRIQRDGRAEDFDEAMEILTTESSFGGDEEPVTLAGLLTSSPKKIFQSWSTGHKIVMHLVASLVAYVLPHSLVLLDEPESHLHPPLLATLMHAIRNLLKKRRAFAIVATHSPVVIQETMARNIYIVRREGEATKLFDSSIETFGENVGSITSEIFGLNSQITDFHSVLDRLVVNLRDQERIERIFSEHGLSMQARAYVMSKLTNLFKSEDN